MGRGGLACLFPRIAKDPDATPPASPQGKTFKLCGGLQNIVKEAAKEATSKPPPSPTPKAAEKTASVPKASGEPCL